MHNPQANHGTGAYERARERGSEPRNNNRQSSGPNSRQTSRLCAAHLACKRNKGTHWASQSKVRCAIACPDNIKRGSSLRSKVVRTTHTHSGQAIRWANQRRQTVLKQMRSSQANHGTVAFERARERGSEQRNNNRQSSGQNSWQNSRLCAAHLACQREREHNGHHNQRSAAQLRARLSSSGVSGTRSKVARTNTLRTSQSLGKATAPDHMEANAQFTSEPWHQCR